VDLDVLRDRRRVDVDVDDLGLGREPILPVTRSSKRAATEIRQSEL
jgi:hypothetical protein